MTGSSNGLKLNGRRVIAWTNHDQGLWHHMVSLGHNGKQLWQTASRNDDNGDHRGDDNGDDADTDDYDDDDKSNIL